ncbi:hypothetical protein RA280_21065 [Cupriavidus sp. CV2]|uniref:hypothetical protein n=1 Tax=Cupriavidus ulmosensis TaxID=3065913 RepID=UPI00296B0E00|nr:hypothetical protein [Cupriavidus sp. CV2]MDW3684197.1 hypothetical protein [Cupriavidus sp. CV2]
MQVQGNGHSVIVYPDMIGGWYFAEVNGKAVYRFGPFESHKVVRELVVVLFPKIPVLELVERSPEMDDSALMILGNGERVSQVTEEQDTARQ